MSQLSTGDIPARRKDDFEDWPWEKSFTKREHAVAAHKVLFSLLVHKPFQFPTNVSRSMSIIADVLIYAELYGLAEQIIHQLRDVIRWDGMWDDIAKNPEFYLGLSQHFRDAEMFEDAFKHIVAVRCFHMHSPFSSCDQSYLKLGDLKEMTYEELRLSVLDHRAVLMKLACDLATGVQNQLKFKVPVYYKSNRSEKVTSTYTQRFLDPKTIDRYGADLEGKEKWRVHGRNQNERLGFITRGFFAEWLSWELTARHISGCEYTKEIQMYG